MDQPSFDHRPTLMITYWPTMLLVHRNNKSLPGYRIHEKVPIAQRDSVSRWVLLMVCPGQLGTLHVSLLVICLFVCLECVCVRTHMHVNAGMPLLMCQRSVIFYHLVETMDQAQDQAHMQVSLPSEQSCQTLLYWFEWIDHREQNSIDVSLQVLIPSSLTRLRSHGSEVDWPSPLALPWGKLPA